MDYKEKLEEAKRLYQTANQDQRYVLESLFPELKESEDERIRKILIEDIKDTLSSEGFRDYNPEYTEKLKEALAWLEKQGEQKPFDYENANIQQKDFAPDTVGYKEERLTPLERKVKGLLFDFHINATDGMSFDGTMAIVHNLITLCQQEQKPAWSEDDETVLEDIEEAIINYWHGQSQEDLLDWLKSLKKRIGG